MHAIEYLLDDHDDEESQRILTELENIDDECDQKGISFVKIDDDHVAKEYGVDHLPTLVYFENKIPSLYDGDLANEEQVLAWLIEQLASDTIEDITDEMLDKLIKKSAHLAVLFCKSINQIIYRNRRPTATGLFNPQSRKHQHQKNQRKNINKRSNVLSIRLFADAAT